jgi:hypothetical protein
MVTEQVQRATDEVVRIKAEIDMLSFDAPRWLWNQKLAELEDAELILRIVSGANWAA